MVEVRDYTRKVGAEVKAHDRSAPGAREQLTVLAGLNLVISGALRDGAKARGEAEAPPANPSAVAPALSGSEAHGASR